MSSNPPFVLHEYKHEYPHQNKARERENLPRLPPIPDLRFELSYLRSIGPHIHIRREPASQGSVSEEKSRMESSGAKEDEELVHHTASLDKIEVEWGHVLWITARDQVISPLLQGALWAIISFYFTPFSARIGHGLVERLPSRRKEGTGVGWLRSWVKGFGLAS